MYYLRLMDTIAGAERRSGLSALDVLPREMLRLIVSAHMQSKPVRMTDLRRFGSFPTIKSNVDLLVSGGWIERIGDDKDRRTVRLCPRPKSVDAIRATTDALKAALGPALRDDCNSCLDKILTEMSSALDEQKRRLREFIESQ